MGRRDHEIALGLSRFTPGELPLDLFNEVARLTVTPVVELLLIFGDEVLLLRRPETDSFWPGKLALPGRIITANGFNNVYQYALALVSRFDVENELVFRGVEIIYTLRGVEIAVVYQASLKERVVGDNFKMVPLGYIGDEPDVIMEHGALIKKYAHNS